MQMRKQDSNFAASTQGNSKGKKILLPLVFAIVALIVVIVILQSVVGAFRPAAASSGLSSEPDIPLMPTSEPASSGSEDTQFEEFTTYPEAGDYLGHLTVSGTAVDCDVYYGDSETEFQKGAGTYKGAKIPGEGGTILMGAHTNTYFRDFESAEVGADVTLTTAYGEYHYVITDMKVATDTDTTAYDLDAEEENLIMYTCYPFGTLNYTDERFFVYCDYVSGPEIVPPQQ